MRLLAVLLSALTLVACIEPDASSGRASVDTEAEPATTPDATAANAPPAPPGMPTSPATVSPASRNADSSAKLALDGEGLRVFSVPSGASRLIAFGQPQGESVRVLEAVLGAPPAEQAENIDCGASLAKWPNGLTTWFSGGLFVGWSLGSQDSGPASAGGVRVGVVRTELENGPSTVEISRTTLGTEFLSGGIAGLLESPRADARVSNLWAGATCIAR